MGSCHEGIGGYLRNVVIHDINDFLSYAFGRHFPSVSGPKGLRRPIFLLCAERL